MVGKLKHYDWLTGSHITFPVPIPFVHFIWGIHKDSVQIISMYKIDFAFHWMHTMN
jgi:hypothetical protein